MDGVSDDVGWVVRWSWRGYVARDRNCISCARHCCISSLEEPALITASSSCSSKYGIARRMMKDTRSTTTYNFFDQIMTIGRRMQNRLFNRTNLNQVHCSDVPKACWDRGSAQLPACRTRDCEDSRCDPEKASIMINEASKNAMCLIVS